jgi:putative SOS response-associated peptidase YedK
MAERVATTPAFREAWPTIFTSGRRRRPGKRPYAIGLAHDSPIAFAGLWSVETSPGRGHGPHFTIITGPPNELCAPIHNRMAGILSYEGWRRWPGEDDANTDELRGPEALIPLS